jgi:hypothetical protein
MVDSIDRRWCNYETCNVALWIKSDEKLRAIAAATPDYESFIDKVMEVALGSDGRFDAIAFQTPDGVAWNDSGIDMREMETLWSEKYGKDLK